MIAELVLTAFALILASVYFALVLLSPTPPLTAASERTYQSPKADEPIPLPTNFDAEPTCELSVVVPAYNEAKRLGIMLTDAVRYLETRSIPKSTSTLGVGSGIERGSYEVLIVDDGSRDNTTQVALRLARELNEEWNNNGRKMRGEIKVITLVKNRGKGGSVKHGMLHSSGKRVLFVDADGASHFPDLELLQAEMDRIELDETSAKGHGLVVGSRAHLVQTEAVVKRSFLRNLLMRLFHSYLFVLGIRSIRDTQCGFKLHTRSTASLIYPLLHSPSWIFDCEVLLLANLAGIETREVGIKWQEVEGSKVDLIKDSIGMAVDLLVIRGNYWLGRWETPRSVGGGRGPTKILEKEE